MPDDLDTTTEDGRQSIEEIEPLGDKPFDTGEITLSTDEVAQIWRRIDQGLTQHQEEFWPTYNNANLLWQGEHWAQDRGMKRYDGKLVINVIPGIIQSLVESVTFSEADFTVKPWGPVSERVGRIANSILHFYLSDQQANANQHIKAATYDSKMYGVGFLQCGWKFKTPDVDMEDGRLQILPPGATMDDAQRWEQNGLLPSGMTAADFVEADTVLDDRFQIQRINPMEVIVAAGCNEIVDNWPWVAKVVNVPLAELKNDRQFKSKRRRKGSKGTYSTDTVLDVRDINGTSALAEPYDIHSRYLPDYLPKEDNLRPPDVKYAELIEYYEAQRRIIVTLCREDRTRYVRAVKWPWKSKKYPFLTIHNTKLPDEFYGKSVPLELWDQQVELNESRTQNMEARRQTNRMYVYMEDALSQKAINAIQRGTPGSLIPVKAGNPAGLDAVRPIQHAALQPEVYKSYEWAIQGMELLSHLSQYQFHSAPTKRVSATESQIIDKANGILFMADAKAVEVLWKQVGEWCLDMAEQYAPVIRGLAIFDKDEDPSEWIDFTGDMIRGEKVVEIWPKSTQPPDAQSDLQQNAQVLQILLQAAQLQAQLGGQLPRNLAIVMRKSLEILGERNIDQLLPLPPEQPQNPTMAQMALQQGGAPPGGAAPPNAPPPPPGQPMPQPQLLPEQVQQILNTLPPEQAALLLHGGKGR